MVLDRSALSRLALVVMLVAGAAACGQGGSRDRGTPVAARLADGVSAPPEGVSCTPDACALPAVAHDEVDGWADVEQGARGDAVHGKSLVAKYECNRCHEGTGQPAQAFERQCVGCHQLIAAEKLPFPREQLDAWQKATRHYITTPSLATTGRTLRASWIASFLQEPVKIRPHEEEWMPRLSIPESDARDLAAFLTSGADEPRRERIDGDVARGKAIVSRKGCFVCHEFTGAARVDVAMEVLQVAPEQLARGIVQAPDLRLARERFRPDAMARWIHDPASVRPDAVMPTLGLTEQEARDAAAYVLRTPLAPLPPAGPPVARLPVLERHVSYEEVASRVFRKSCTHCHADPGSKGDPGPGSTGGFGFAPRGVALLSFPGTQRGYIGDDGARRSLFVRESALERWGGSRLVAALVARHEETAGRPVAEVRGMPMGLPGLPAEDIQLVETWVSQGAPAQ
jgi:cytochrome c2